MTETIQLVQLFESIRTCFEWQKCDLTRISDNLRNNLVGATIRTNSNIGIHIFGKKIIRTNSNTGIHIFGKKTVKINALIKKPGKSNPLMV